MCARLALTPHAVVAFIPEGVFQLFDRQAGAPVGRFAFPGDYGAQLRDDVLHSSSVLHVGPQGDILVLHLRHWDKQRIRSPKCGELLAFELPQGRLLWRTQIRGDGEFTPQASCMFGTRLIVYSASATPEGSTHMRLSAFALKSGEMTLLAEDRKWNCGRLEQPEIHAIGDRLLILHDSGTIPPKIAYDLHRHQWIPCRYLPTGSMCASSAFPDSFWSLAD